MKDLYLYLILFGLLIIMVFVFLNSNQNTEMYDYSDYAMNDFADFEKDANEIDEKLYEKEPVNPEITYKTEVVEMNVSLGKEFTIDVVSNPIVGYKWEVKFNESFLKLKERIYEPYSKEIIEEGGNEKFTFIPLKTGETNITMRYGISWDYDILLEKIYHITIQ